MLVGPSRRSRARCGAWRGRGVRRVGMSPSGLSKRLNGDLRMTLVEVEQIAEALGVDAFTLLDLARAEHLAAA